MKRRWLIGLIGLFLGVGGYCGFYLCATSPQRELCHQKEPELAWLKKEFHLSDAEFERVRQLHEGYKPRCQELCGRIAAKNAELNAIVAKNPGQTAAIEEKRAQIAALKAQCQASMLEHFAAVSRAMPGEEGTRYLAWIQEKTLHFEHGATPAAASSCEH
jgi:hypothetical protein